VLANYLPQLKGVNMKLKIKCDCKMPNCWLELDNDKIEGKAVFVSIKNFKSNHVVEMTLNEKGIKQVIKFLSKR